MFTFRQTTKRRFARKKNRRAFRKPSRFDFFTEKFIKRRFDDLQACKSSPIRQIVACVPKKGNLQTTGYRSILELSRMGQPCANASSRNPQFSPFFFLPVSQLASLVLTERKNPQLLRENVEKRRWASAMRRGTPPGCDPLRLPGPRGRLRKSPLLHPSREGDDD